jgi:hypothetical protein
VALSVLLQPPVDRSIGELKYVVVKGGYPNAKCCVPWIYLYAVCFCKGLFASARVHWKRIAVLFGPSGQQGK